MSRSPNRSPKSCSVKAWNFLQAESKQVDELLADIDEKFRLSMIEMG